jgi:hypothetical protein
MKSKNKYRNNVSRILYDLNERKKSDVTRPDFGI